MSETPDVSHLQWTVYWEREYTTALAPERLKLDFHPHRPLMTNMPLHEQRTLAADGYKVLPDDCGPVRMVGQYGWLVRMSGGLQASPDERWIEMAGAPKSFPKNGCLDTNRFPGCTWIRFLNSGYAKLCCGIRFYYPKQLGIMLKDIPNHFYHYPERTFSVWEGIKSQEYKLTPNLYDFLPDYDAFVANVLLQLEKPTTLKRGDPVALVVPVLLPKQFRLEELTPDRKQTGPPR